MTIESGVEPRGWGLGRAIAYRFLFVYVALYCLPFPAGEVPWTQWLADAYAWPIEKLTVLVGHHLLGVEPVQRMTGSGDTLFAYVQALTIAMLAAIAAGSWTAAAATVGRRRRVDYHALDGALRVYVRYTLGFALLGYGMFKVFKAQFPFPSPDQLHTTYGESSPMGLLWRFMGYSPGYNLFAGGVEVAAGALLLFRRTQLVGALIGAAAMTNVVMLNLCYDVPVKLYSMHLLALCIYVMAPDLGRLARLFVLGRAIEAPPARRPTSRRLAWARRIAKTLFVGYTMYELVTTARDAEAAYASFAARQPGKAESPLAARGFHWISEYPFNQ
jgi:hypothetical protein